MNPMKSLCAFTAGLWLCLLSPAFAAPPGSDTVGFWMSLQRDEQGSFLAGAITMLGGLRLLQCPSSIALKDVRDRIDKRRLAGQSRFDDRLSWEILIVHYSMGCSLDPLVFDSLDPALRKKLPNTQ